ncbi:nucleoside phosphorylase [Desulfococcus multivorans]|jgi:uridine phosphorylase|uniref:Uridine phosphorylase n=1 Tax=Desulfococcus multivorans DSM 2059 TaxID=1121405 RepID=S7TJE1_DESML|nr:nucleoside phosphorylase [Desulfococcus multivorans]EPR37287.1 purine or other phosphorylase family 1 [Desulfococcus multivorans DSM 2059]MDX9819226.1 nucleoside phosphorylase [Desulfococcus multivorans]SJZ70173.1 Uridine phosphorylase [Desulfococcus multivorans DSM 2059]
MNCQTFPDPSEAPLKNSKTAIVRPIVGRKSPKLGPLAMMISSGPDFERLVRILPAAEHPSRLLMSRLFLDADARYAVIGPVVGAPYAVMLLEPLIAWGAREICFMGWCGAISPKATIGDIIVPTGAIIDEGTSLGYDASLLDTARPSETLNRRIKTVLTGRGCDFLEGLVWSTDAIYRETPEKVTEFQARNALAVEMELSALFTAGRYRGIQIGAVLVVSDELTTLSWKPGFKLDRFRESRQTLIEAMKDLCQNPL